MNVKKVRLYQIYIPWCFALNGAWRLTKKIVFVKDIFYQIETIDKIHSVVSKISSQTKWLKLFSFERV